MSRNREKEIRWRREKQEEQRNSSSSSLKIKDFPLLPLLPLLPLIPSYQQQPSLLFSFTPSQPASQPRFAPCLSFYFMSSFIRTRKSGAPFDDAASTTPFPPAHRK